MGQIHDGIVGCAPTTGHSGRFDVSWGRDANGNFLPGRDATNSLAPWLDPNNSNVMTTNTIPIATITGPNHVCTSGSTYTIQKAPQGLHITWQVSPGHWFQSTTQNGTGASATIMAASNTVGGIGELQFTTKKEVWFTVKLM